MSGPSTFLRVHRWCQACLVDVTETADIDAPPERVWSVLVDVARWPSWTSSVRDARLLTPGPLAEGSRAQLRQPGLPRATWVVTELREGVSFTWTSRSAGQLSVADHVLTDGGGTTQVTLRFRQVGAFSGLARLLFGRTVARYVATEAAGLKARCERGDEPPASSAP